MRRLICKTFGHHRNIRGVRRLGIAWRSTCIHCHQPLIRVSGGAWRLFRSTEIAVPENADELPLFARHKQVARPTAEL
jgi:hypothetical protein